MSNIVKAHGFRFSFSERLLIELLTKQMSEEAIRWIRNIDYAVPDDFAIVYKFISYIWYIDVGKGNLLDPLMLY
ncbi:MAG: hypothetical protein GY861_21240 [bacterium]|nr:hypothetical protein [bacterium]